MTHIQLIEDLPGFSALRPEWNDLLARSSADTIFLTWEWVSSWWESYAGKGDALHVIVVREGTGELIGVLPLYRQLQPWLPFKPIKSLRFIGDGSWDSDYLDMILIQGLEERILVSVWQWLNQRREAWDVLQLSGIPQNSSTWNWLERTTNDTGVLSRSQCIPCLVTDLNPSWEDYLASLKPRFRTKVRSTLREMTHNGFRFRTVETVKDLESGLQTLYALHTRRWESKGSEGVFRIPAKRRFYELFSRQFLERGWLAFDLLELNGNPVACQMCFRYRGTQFLLQEGFDPQFASESVGIGLRAMALKKAIENGVRQYDFLAGLGRHKTQWQARMKQCHSVSLGPSTIQNMLHLKVPIFIESLRERVKSILPDKVLEIRRRLVAS